MTPSDKAAAIPKALALGPAVHGGLAPGAEAHKEINEEREKAFAELESEIVNLEAQAAASDNPIPLRQQADVLRRELNQRRYVK